MFMHTAVSLWQQYISIGRDKHVYHLLHTIVIVPPLAPHPRMVNHAAIVSTLQRLSVAAVPIYT